jgi:hypothetical protein
MTDRENDDLERALREPIEIKTETLQPSDKTLKVRGQRAGRE